MHRQKRMNDAVHWYMSELTSRIVAESGIPSDRFHLGKIILQSLKDAPDDFILQIDGGTNQSETGKSVLKRTVQCANFLRALGLQRGDVIVLMAPNHLDVAIPYYAGFYLGVIVAPVDISLTSKELQDHFQINEPKIIFCQSEKTADAQTALKELGSRAQIVTFNKDNRFINFAESLQKYGQSTSVENFKPADFNPEETIAILIPTSGTTGTPKSAASTHKNLSATAHYTWARHTKFPTPFQLYLVVAPLQWLSAILSLNLSCILRYTRLQSSLPITQDHAYHLINTYKPTATIASPTLMTTLFKPGDRERCDFTSFDFIGLGGSSVPGELIREIKSITPNTEVFNMYGLTESTAVVFHADDQPVGCCGKPVGHIQYRLINVETSEDIIEPNVSGELWLKGPSIFKAYYKNPEVTKETITEDGWLKTGDMFYRDQNWNFFFVERIKLLLKYRNHQISPVEVENVIRKHPGVMDVVVTGVPDQELGELIVACVVRRPGFNPTAQEIKDLVKESLTDTKQLRGGVIFLQEIPMTITTKVHRRKVKEMVLTMDRE